MPELTVESPTRAVAQGGSLQNTMRVRVMLAGSPMAGETLNFSTPMGEASLSSTAAVTDALGFGSVGVTVADMSQNAQVTACLAPSNDLCASLFLTVVPSSQTRVNVISGAGQLVPAGRGFRPVIVQVTDSQTPPNPVAGALVTFTSNLMRFDNDNRYQLYGESAASHFAMKVILASWKDQTVTDVSGLSSIVPASERRDAYEIEIMASIDGGGSAQLEVECSGPTGQGGSGSANAIPATLFGLHINKTTSIWPTVSFGSLRTLDLAAGVAWPFANPAAGQFCFAAADCGGGMHDLDTWLKNAQSHNVDVLYDLGRTPHWALAAAHQSDATCQYDSMGHGQCYPPSDLESGGANALWSAWAASLAQHIAGLDATYQHTVHFEPWNEVTMTKSWRGTDEELAQMTIDAALQIKAWLPDIKITTPNTTNWSPPAAKGVATKLQSILAATPTLGAQNGDATVANSVDVISFHSYMNSPDPEEIINLANELRSAVPGAYELWDTEFSWGANTPNVTDEDLRSAFLARSYLAGWSAGITRLYWYGWDIANFGKTALWSSTGDGGRCTTPTTSGYLCKTGVAYQQVHDWMVGNEMPSPCTGPMPLLGGSSSYGLWSCRFYRPDGGVLSVVWNTSPCMAATLDSCTTTAYSAPDGVAGYYTLDDSQLHPVVAAEVMTVGAKPVAFLVPVQLPPD